MILYERIIKFTSRVMTQLHKTVSFTQNVPLVSKIKHIYKFDTKVSTKILFDSKPLK